ncbi:ATP-binding protein [Streptomyces zhihengii]|uniref:ATP-binding protein n=1 Tax=Streptomyces zhihengii TaxID=1818004 RepID=A0ABS2ULI4_9ACTN|nr:ATP-binding protein [Streptomyces zhihengii]MBM9618380.1 ATP-binding protein [Streptomyces zhihengii]
MNRSVPRPADPAPLREFAMQFTSTPRGARLARRLVSHRMHEWGHPYEGHGNEAVTLVAAELVANAVTHGHVPGRDFHLRLTATREAARVEVTDTRSDRQPAAGPRPAAPDGESGRGLLLVEALACDWGVTPRATAPGKAVWAVVPLPPDAGPAGGGRPALRREA